MRDELFGYAEHEDFENGREDMERLAMATEAERMWEMEAAFDEFGRDFYAEQAHDETKDGGR